MKVKLFSNIGSMVETLLSKRTKEELHFSKNFNNYITKKDYLFCIKMMDEGYQATEKEKNLINDLILIKIEDSEYTYNDIRFLKSISNHVRMMGLIKAVPILNQQNKSISCNKARKNYNTSSTLIKSKSKLTQEEFIIGEINGNKEWILNETLSFLKSYKKYYGSYIKKGDINTNKQDSYKRDYLKKFIYLNIILIREELLMPEEINLLKEEYKKVSEYFENRIYGTYKEDNFDRIGKYSLDDLVNTLTELTKNSEVNEKDDLLRQIKSYNSRNKSLSEEIKDLINQEDYSVEKLPIEAQQKVVSIKELVEKLNNEKVTQFFNERLPVILKKLFIDQLIKTVL